MLQAEKLPVYCFECDYNLFLGLGAFIYFDDMPDWLPLNAYIVDRFNYRITRFVINAEPLLLLEHVVVVFNLH